MPHTSRIFYGWWLVVVCALLQGTGAGVSFYLYSVLAGAVEQEFAPSRTLLMLGATGLNVAMGVLAPFLGQVMDRFSIRNVFIVAAVIAGSGFLVMSFSGSIWGVIASYTLMVSIGVTVLMMLSAPVLLSRWFVRHRGVAIGIAAVGTQIGGLTIPPVVAFLIEAFEWRFAIRALGLFVMVAVPLLTYWSVVDRPEDIGLQPDGEAPSEGQAQGAQNSHPQGSLREAMMERNFWLIALARTIVGGTFTAVIANLALFATDVGVPREQAAFIISIYALVGIAGSPLIGRLCDIIDIRMVFAGVLATAIAGLFLFLIADGYRGFAIAAAVLGIGASGVLPLWGAIVGKLFGLQIYGRVYGAMAFLGLLASAGSPLLSGWLFDTTGGHQALLAGAIVLMAIPLLYAPLIRLKPGNG